MHRHLWLKSRSVLVVELPALLALIHPDAAKEGWVQVAVHA